MGHFIWVLVELQVSSYLVEPTQRTTLEISLTCLLSRPSQVNGVTGLWPWTTPKSVASLSHRCARPLSTLAPHSLLCLQRTSRKSQMLLGPSRCCQSRHSTRSTRLT